MKSRFRLLPARWLLPAAALAFPAVLPTSRAQQVTAFADLAEFSSPVGLDPQGELVLGKDGNFYGTAATGGSAGFGTVYRLTPAGELDVVASFNGRDGDLPKCGLVQDGSGNFYGTTSEGGTVGNGTVFMVTPAGVLTTLHSFDADGSHPQGTLAPGSDGNFYGTTASTSATRGDGTVFMISPAGRFKTLHTFHGSDGASPQAGLTEGSDGNFYGTTELGGAQGDGTLFKITPQGALTTLYAFTGDDDGQQPLGRLVLAGDGDFYGTTSQKGAGGDGTVFRVTPGGVLSTLYSFSGFHDGAFPQAGLTVGSDGALYGTTLGSGVGPLDGSVYRITLGGSFSGLVTFFESNGGMPMSGLTVGSDGALYGTTTDSDSGGGTVFKVIQTHPGFFTFQLSIGDGVFYLAFPGGNSFGYYSFLAEPNSLYHFDLGYEYVFDARDGNDGVYLYDLQSGDFFYTSPTFPFPYLYDFDLKSALYYYPDASNPGRYTRNPRYFYDFASGAIITR